jgi:uncharacterized protein (TIGR01615 family)
MSGQVYVPNWTFQSSPIFNLSLSMGSRRGAMLFDHETDDEAVSESKLGSLSSVKERLEHLNAPTGDFSQKLLRDMVGFRKSLVAEESSCDPVLLAVMLSNVGYSISLRNALGGGQNRFRNLYHEFLLVQGQGEFNGVSFIVEPHFREHFSIPNPTPRYTEIIQSVPEIFVGTQSHLISMVTLLCAEMGVAFEGLGQTPPPWRRCSAMLSMWLPARSTDTAFSPAPTLGPLPEPKPADSPVVFKRESVVDEWTPMVRLDSQPGSPYSPSLPSLSVSGLSLVTNIERQENMDGECVSPQRSLLSARLLSGAIPIGLGM